VELQFCDMYCWLERLVCNPLTVSLCQVKEVVTVMEKEMGLTNAWLLHKFCKVIDSYQLILLVIPSCFGHN